MLKEECWKTQPKANRKDEEKGSIYNPQQLEKRIFETEVPMSFIGSVNDFHNFLKDSRVKAVPIEHNC